MQKVLLNALNIESGGGLQKTSSFLTELSSRHDYQDRFLAITKRGGQLAKLCEAKKVPQHQVAGNNVGRLFFELSCRRKFSSRHICFNLGGLVLVNGGEFLINVSECAFSNLFYPEIDFWHSLSYPLRTRKTAIDLYRRFAIARSDYWIFETAAIRKRAIGLCGFPEERCAVLRPAPSALVSHDNIVKSAAERFNLSIPQVFRFLFLSGAQPNKRIHLLPEIAQEMVERGCCDFCFVTTMPANHAYTMSIQERFSHFGLSSHFCNLGQIPPNEVSSLTSIVNAMCTFSRLESFSNNFLEAWKMGRPLIATDADWARDSGEGGALYVNPEKALETAEQLISAVEDEAVSRDLVEAGRRRLLSFPTQQERTQQYLALFEVAEDLGPCPKALKQRIHWPRIRRQWLKR